MHLPVLLGEIIIPCQDCNGKERIYDSSGIMVKTTQAAGPVFLDLAMALTLQTPRKEIPNDQRAFEAQTSLPLQGVR